ncbi:helix-turn-helix domain-containing protein [Pseudoduganella sp. UC29_106]|uniref:helix-turn-helix domain-containing protein n=1 Tax=Pseudoduganella sp. UC29_106 TaxID=3374553 RepID=UPI003757CB89
MDSMIAAAARALATGDLLGALKRVALREDAPALALRGIAMAQLGDLSRAKELLKAAAHAFGPREAVARARCIVAEAEIALVSRDLGWQPRALAAARATLQAHGDAMNTAHAGHLEARRLLLLGRLDEASKLLSALDPAPLPPALRAAHDLTLAGIAMRRLHAAAAADALARGRRAALEARIPALAAEVDAAARVLAAPAARMTARGEQRLLQLGEVESLLASDTVVVDACAYAVRVDGAVVALAGRPVLFTLARVLAECWPGDATRHVLVSAAFRGKEADESYRARLRVELGRLRSAIAGMAEINATKDGFVLAPCGDREVAVLAPPGGEGEHGALRALLSDGEAWSSSALSIALGSSPRTVQRALESLAAAGKVHSFGRGPARRWTIPSVPGFPSTLLLPGALPGG